MECLLLYWDELDDLYWSIAALGEQARRMATFVLFIAVATAVAALSVILAWQQPDLSLLVAALLSGSLIFRPRGFRDPANR